MLQNTNEGTCSGLTIIPLDPPGLPVLQTSKDSGALPLTSLLHLQCASQHQQQRQHLQDVTALQRLIVRPHGCWFEKGGLQVRLWGDAVMPPEADPSCLTAGPFLS
jgi:hypothetical protein